MKRVNAWLSATLLTLTLTPPSPADQAGRRYAENALHAQPAIHIRVAPSNADITGSDNRALQAAVDYVGNLGGGVVEIGPGNYLMRDSLHLRSRVTIRGAGEETVLRKAKEFRSPLVADGDFGEAALVSHFPRMATLIAVTDARVLRLKSGALFAQPWFVQAVEPCRHAITVLQLAQHADYNNNLSIYQFSETLRLKNDSTNYSR